MKHKKLYSILLTGAAGLASIATALGVNPHTQAYLNVRNNRQTVDLEEVEFGEGEDAEEITVYGGRYYVPNRAFWDEGNRVINTHDYPGGVHRYDAQALLYTARTSLIYQVATHGNYLEYTYPSEEYPDLVALDVPGYFNDVFLPAFTEARADVGINTEARAYIWHLVRAISEDVDTFNDDVGVSDGQIKAETAHHLAQYYRAFGIPAPDLGLMATKIATAIDPDLEQNSDSPVLEYLTHPNSEAAQAEMSAYLRGDVERYGGGVVTQPEASRLFIPTIGMNDVESLLTAQAIEARGYENFPQDIQSAAIALNGAEADLQATKQQLVNQAILFVQDHGDELDALITGAVSWEKIGLPENEMTEESYRQFFDLYSLLGGTVDNYLHIAQQWEDDRPVYSRQEAYSASLHALQRTLSEQYQMHAGDEDALNELRLRFFMDQLRNPEFITYLKWHDLGARIGLGDIEDSLFDLDQDIQQYWLRDMEMYGVLTQDNRDTDPILQANITAGIERHYLNIALDVFGFDALPTDLQTQEFLLVAAQMAREISPTHMLGGSAEANESFNINHVNMVYNEEGSIRAVKNFWDQLSSMGLVGQSYDVEQLMFWFHDMGKNNNTQVLSQSQYETLYPYFKEVEGVNGSPSYSYYFSYRIFEAYRHAVQWDRGTFFEETYYQGPEQELVLNRRNYSVSDLGVYYQYPYWTNFYWTGNVGGIGFSNDILMEGTVFDFDLSGEIEEGEGDEYFLYADAENFPDLSQYIWFGYNELGDVELVLDNGRWEYQERILVMDLVSQMNFTVDYQGIPLAVPLAIDQDASPDARNAALASLGEQVAYNVQNIYPILNEFPDLEYFIAGGKFQLDANRILFMDPEFSFFPDGRVAMSFQAPGQRDRQMVPDIAPFVNALGGIHTEHGFIQDLTNEQAFEQILAPINPHNAAGFMDLPVPYEMSSIPQFER